MSEPNRLLQQIQVNTARGALYQKDLPVRLPDASEDRVHVRLDLSGSEVSSIEWARASPVPALAPN
jgi:hypothetical protein